MLMQFGSFKHIMSFINNNNFTSTISTNFDSLDGFKVSILGGEYDIQLEWTI
jgi:hypothetical protein